MGAGADLSLPGIARLVTEFLGRLGLEDVTLVGNDTGGAVASCWPPTAPRVSAGSSWPHVRPSITSRPG